MKKQAESKTQTSVSTKEDEKEAFIVRDSERSALYASIKGVSFSPDGKHLVFVATKGDNQCVVVDGKEGKTFDLLPHGGEPQWIDHARYRYLGMRGESLYLVQGALER